MVPLYQVSGHLSALHEHRFRARQGAQPALHELAARSAFTPIRAVQLLSYDGGARSVGAPAHVTADGTQTIDRPNAIERA
jgi:hypothetical protein